MCGIVGIVAHTPVNQLLYDGLLLPQHRGQDAAGIVTSEGPVFHMFKGPGLVQNVFRTRNMRDLTGRAGIGHCRYPTAGSAFSAPLAGRLVSTVGRKITVIALAIGTANAIVGYYAWTGYRWTRIAGLISAALTFGVLVLNQAGWPAIPFALVGAGLLWLPPAGAFFAAWRARRHPEQVFAPPTVGVKYGPLPRFRKS